ncbi:protein preY, mitochondrial [Denticeps clupeoides]|nr:protein preY, mitochondrial [Denticeps clupeoides]
MSQTACGRFASAVTRAAGKDASLLATAVRRLASDASDKSRFDTSLLDVLVCPLSKKPLRYDEKTNELINEELGIAYPVVSGIPNMIPQDARLIKKNPEAAAREETTQA